MMAARAVVLAALSWCVAVTAAAQDVDPLEERANDVAELFGAEEPAYDELFSTAFLDQVPPDQLDTIFGDFHSRTGGVTAVVPAERPSPTSGRFRLHTDGGFAVPIDLAIAPEPPHKIVGLWLSAPVPLAASFDELVAEIEALPGKIGFTATRLDPDPQVMTHLNADVPLALGSAFKLFVLAALHEAIVEGELAWDTVVELDPRWKSLPSGILQTWPDEAPLTIHTLASLMISRSDNTATDALIHVLGRERVEAQVERHAPRSAPRNRPFLTTRELFQLKNEPEGERTQQFLAADASQRRTLLDEGGWPPVDSLKPFPDGAPTLVEELEWFASAREMALLLDHLRKQFDDPHGSELKGILTINPGINLDELAWPYIGFKGGSEPGVLNLSYLLRSGSGVWYAVVASWNNPEDVVQTETLVGLAQRAIELLVE